MASPERGSASCPPRTCRPPVHRGRPYCRATVIAARRGDEVRIDRDGLRKAVLGWPVMIHPRRRGGWAEGGCGVCAGRCGHPGLRVHQRVPRRGQRHRHPGGDQGRPSRRGDRPGRGLQPARSAAAGGGRSGHDRRHRGADGGPDGGRGRCRPGQRDHHVAVGTGVGDPGLCGGAHPEDGAWWLADRQDEGKWAGWLRPGPAAAHEWEPCQACGPGRVASTWTEVGDRCPIGLAEACGPVRHPAKESRCSSRPCPLARS
jgi:hypothetical protein